MHTHDGVFIRNVELAKNIGFSKNDRSTRVELYEYSCCVASECMYMSTRVTVDTCNLITESHGHHGTYHIGAGEQTLEVDTWSVPSHYALEERHLRTIRLGTESCVPYQTRHVFIPTEDEAGHPGTCMTSHTVVIIGRCCRLCWYASRHYFVVSSQTYAYGVRLTRWVCMFVVTS